MPELNTEYAVQAYHTTLTSDGEPMVDLLTENRSSNSFKSASLQLYDQLFKGYQKDIRPVKNWADPTIVAIDITIYAILNVVKSKQGQALATICEGATFQGEKNQLLATYIWYRQSWTDEHLMWNPEMFGNIKRIAIPTNRIWVPDILIQELVDTGKAPDTPFVYLTHVGTILNLKPIQVVTVCNLEIYYFPVDVQECVLTFISWLLTARDVDITLERSAEEVKKDRRVFINNGEWELLHVLTKHILFQGQYDQYEEESFTVSLI
ncbi:hypothetical protein XELAEV_18035542mg [Xenopus laevis]|uniref:Neurotransmitter-gated ion-channel ligand-binding domain-containing protein n=1 Tax=Xenopus laevis TaxID=8355 RepID=A0A974CFY5_XENLA|nr:hypothetical protein XELAEV_18035542mg [Xenopus laevis]